MVSCPLQSRVTSLLDLQRSTIMSVYDSKTNLCFRGMELTVYVSFSMAETINQEKCSFCGSDDSYARVIDVHEIEAANNDFDEGARAEVVELVQAMLQHNVPYCEKCTNLFELAREQALDQHGATLD